MASIISVEDICKTYDGGFEALKSVNLEIKEGEIIALLGPNGAGKTTLISTICGLSTATSGRITVDGFDIVDDYREARKRIGLVPQEITVEPFETVLNTTRLTRGLFGRPRDDAHLENVLKSLSLWDKKDNRNTTLSGGMKRRVLIAKALSHDPKVLFLDEPSAGVDVELRKDMWALVRELRAKGTTIILTTHYIEEAEEIADRIAVINKGEILLVEDKSALMTKLGKKEMEIELQAPCDAIPAQLASLDLVRAEDGTRLTYSYGTEGTQLGVTRLLAGLTEAGLAIRDISTRQSSLEDIFVDLVKEPS